MTSLTPEIQELLMTAGSWLIGTLVAIIGGMATVIFLAAKLLIKRFLAGAEEWKQDVDQKVDKLTNIMQNASDRTANGFADLTRSLDANNRHLSDRIETTNENVRMVRMLTEETRARVDKSIPELYERMESVETKHERLHAAVITVIKMPEEEDDSHSETLQFRR